MKWLSALAALVAVVAVAVPTAFAGGGNPNGTGQPSQTCLSSTAPSEPGQAAGSPGSPFNEVDGHAGAMYAGSQPQNSNNSKSVSQYDVACYHVSQR
jgi:hypothetical protein